MKKKKYIYLLALLPFAVVVLLYEIFPLVSMTGSSFISDSGAPGFTMENYVTVFTKTLYRRAVANSLRISLISSFIGIVVAFFGAAAAHESRGRAGRMFQAVLGAVSDFSGIPLAFSYMILLGNAGLAANIGKELGIAVLEDFDLYTLNGMCLVYVYFQIPLAVLLLIPLFDGIRTQWKDACILLGGSSATFWRRIGIPVLMPGTFSVFAVLFCNALAAYATVYALMGDNIALLSVQIAGDFIGDVSTRNGLGGALSVVMMALMAGMIFVTGAAGKELQKGRRSV